MAGVQGMTLGVIVRADRRGLAVLSAIMCRHLTPARTLVVDMGRHSPYPCEPDDYPDRFGVVGYDQLRAGGYDWQPFLDGLDVVLTFETPYDFGLFTVAAKRGVRSTLLVMPELDPYVREPGLPRPDVLALPTSWMADRYDDPTILPVPAEPFTPDAGRLVLHPAGTPAAHDRNGTRLFAAAATGPEWMVRVQTTRPMRRGELPLEAGAATVEARNFDRPGDVYDGAQLVVLPRRYGGLSLPMHETLAAGLPLLTTAAGPYAAQLPSTCLLPVAGVRQFEAKGGTIDVHDVDPAAIRAAVNGVMGDDGALRRMRADAAAWTAAHRWEAVGPAWHAALLGSAPSEAQERSGAVSVAPDPQNAATARLGASPADPGV